MFVFAMTIARDVLPLTCQMVEETGPVACAGMLPKRTTEVSIMNNHLHMAKIALLAGDYSMAKLHCLLAARLAQASGSKRVWSCCMRALRHLNQVEYVS